MQSAPELPPVVVDLTDPQDLAQKRGNVAERLADVQRRLADVPKWEAEARKWADVLRFIDSQLPEQLESAAEAATTREPTLLEMVVEVVDREVRKIRAKEVQEILASEGYERPAGAISNALHDAAHRAKLIQAAPGRGMYAPLAYREVELPDGQGPQVAQATYWRTGRVMGMGPTTTGGRLRE